MYDEEENNETIRRQKKRLKKIDEEIKTEYALR
jgi:hypothetical protein